LDDDAEPERAAGVETAPVSGNRLPSPEQPLNGFVG